MKPKISTTSNGRENTRQINEDSEEERERFEEATG
jgi:hypothetical protein